MATPYSVKATPYSSGPPKTDPRSAKTPIALHNNGVQLNPNGNSNQPTIFSAETYQVLQLQHLQSRGGREPPGVSVRPGPSASELLFGGRPSDMHGYDTSAQELTRLQIVTMRQLQRALQNKITQTTRNPMDVWTAFAKLDRRKMNHLNLYDLIAAVAGFNLVASDELVAQLLQALDRDHDGVLSLPEFVAGFRVDNSSSSVQLQEQPDYAVSSRRHFRNLKFHHPLHNVMHLASDSRFGGGE